jgi:hypothetical protein
MTSVLLADICLCRRVDEVAVIGRALLEKASGRRTPHDRHPVGPTEGDRARLAEEILLAVELIQEHFRRWAFALDPRLETIPPQGSGFADLAEVIGLATRAASLLFGPRPVWSWASAMTGGALLSNTNSPFPAPR